MAHMRLHQMPSSQRAAQTELTCEHGGSNDPGKLPCVVARVRWVGAFDAEDVEHGGLGFENGAAADGANFDARHGY